MGELKKPQYVKCPNDAKEEVLFAEDFGQFKKGDKALVHPNNAILYRFKGIVADSSKQEAKQVAKPKVKKKPTPKK